LDGAKLSSSGRGAIADQVSARVTASRITTRNPVPLATPRPLKRDEVRATHLDEIAPFLGDLGEPAKDLRFGHAGIRMP
jgi:hypothetical protein